MRVETYSFGIGSLLQCTTASKWRLEFSFCEFPTHFGQNTLGRDEANGGKTGMIFAGQSCDNADGTCRAMVLFAYDFHQSVTSRALSHGAKSCHHVREVYALQLASMTLCPACKQEMRYCSSCSARGASQQCNLKLSCPTACPHCKKRGH